MKKLFLACLIFISGCGGSNASSFPGVLASLNITTYNITPTADDNGSISPPGVTSVNSGGSQAFAMSCNSGYQLASVTVDGSSAAVTTPYTFTNVTANHTITFTCSVVVAGDGRLPAIQATIASTQADWAATAVRGTPYYFCDCGTGHANGCVAGNNSNAGTDPTAPKQTIEASTTLMNSWNTNAQHTIAFCKGGVFEATAGQLVHRYGCTAGTTCDDVREYASPVFTSSARPLITLPAGSTADLWDWEASGGTGGVRYLNLAFSGPATAKGTFFYDGQHDIVFGNNTWDGFILTIYIANSIGVAKPYNFTITGNVISNAVAMGFLGSADNLFINYNEIADSGSDTSGDHAIYLAADNHVSNTTLIGNYIHGQSSPTCQGDPIEVHGGYTGLTITNNYVYIDPSKSSNGCWGIAVNNIDGYTLGEYFIDLVISNNTVIGSGNENIIITSAPNAIIENNMIINSSTGSTGISAPRNAARSEKGDTVNSNTIIRNNTIYFTNTGDVGNKGIFISREGNGYIVSNNTVSSAQSGGWLECFEYDLPLTSYAFINNNHCYASSITARWEHTYQTLAAWQSHATSYGFDSASVTGNPAFTDAAAYNFSSTYLGGKGNHTNSSMYGFTGNTRSNPPAIGAFEP